MRWGKVPPGKRLTSDLVQGQLEIRLVDALPGTVIAAEAVPVPARVSASGTAPSAKARATLAHEYEHSNVETGGEIPDYFGATYAFLAEECFDDGLHDRAEKFERLFPAFFSASLSANERLSRELAGYDQRTQILFSTETLEDLLEISGYALLRAHCGNGLSI
jgi:hypothetical protein